MDNGSVPKTIEDLDKLIKTSQERRQNSVWGYLLCSLIFPPFSLIVVLYLAWRRKVLHRVLPSLTIFEAILTGVIVVLIFWALNPILLLSKSFVEKQTTVNSRPVMLLQYLLIFLILISLVVGFFYKSKATKEQELSLNITLLLIGLIILLNLFVFLEYYFINTLIYKTVESSL